jgi:hypothetical protein
MVVGIMISWLNIVTYALYIVTYLGLGIIGILNAI